MSFFVLYTTGVSSPSLASSQHLLAINFLRERVEAKSLKAIRHLGINPGFINFLNYVVSVNLYHHTKLYLLHTQASPILTNVLAPASPNQKCPLLKVDQPNATLRGWAGIKVSLLLLVRSFRAGVGKSMCAYVLGLVGGCWVQGSQHPHTFTN